MKRISDAGSSVGRSLIRLLSEKQSAIAASCDDLISYCIGEPDFIAPPNVAEVCIAAIQEGKTKYAPNSGLAELKVAVSKKVEEIYGKKYDPDTEVLITNGGMDSLRMTFRAILDKDDEVLMGDPAWTNHPNHPTLATGKAVRVPLREENNFVMAVEDMEAALTEHTKAVLLNYPNNPTGAIIGYEDVVKICEFAKKHDLYLVSDEVYYNIIFDGEKFWSPAMIDGMKDRTIIIQSFSKTYAMTGWRLGYIFGPADVIEATGLINENSCSCVNTPVQWAGIEALLGERTVPYLDLMRNTYQERRDIVYKMINEIPGLSCVKPKGAFYAFVNIQGTGMTSMEFATQLLEKYHVGLIPGSGFGEAGEGFVRMSYAIETEKIIEGINRIAEFVKNEVRVESKEG